MFNPKILDEVAAILQQYGGWALSVLLMMAIVYLHRMMGALMEKHNTELKALLAECTSVIAENHVYMNRIEEVVERDERTIEKNTEALSRSNFILDDFRRI
jgi:uncharacterized membrane protein